MQLLFWVFYILDKNISLFTGNPPLLTETFCNLTVPVNYETWESAGDPSRLPSAGEVVQAIFKAHLPGDPQLCCLKEDVYRKLLSCRASMDNDNQLLLNIRQLDEEIERWRLSIPAGYRPALLVSKNTLPNSSDEGMPAMMRRMSLQLEYHHLMTIIHTTVRKCTVATSDDEPNLHNVVHSSFDISLVASRSTIWCLKTLVGLIAEDAFR